MTKELQGLKALENIFTLVDCFEDEDKAYSYKDIVIQELKAMTIVKKICDDFELPMGEETSKVVYGAIGKGIKSIITEDEWNLLKEVLG